MLECVVNVSEGRRPQVIDRLSEAAGACLLDVQSDAHHHRSVFTLAGAGEAVEAAARALAAAALANVDLRRHTGVHPRMGAVDVVPFVALAGRAPAGAGPAPLRLADGPIEVAVDARDRFAAWAGEALGLPCFCYGPRRSLPDVRRGAWRGLGPDAGPAHPHPTAGACAVGARPVLVAYNLWLSPPADVGEARRIAGLLRGPHVRALGLAVGDGVQVSCNLIAPWRFGPAEAYDAVARHAAIERAQLVGLLPLSLLEAIAPARWAELDLSRSATVEARLEQAGLDGGRFDLPG